MKKRKKIGYALFGLVALVIAVLVLEVTNTTHFFHKSAKVSAPGKPITKLPSKTAPVKDPSSQTSTIEKGTPTDKNGQVPTGVSNDPSQWATSASGQLTLKAPIKNARLKSGDTITGTASEGPVHYRLIDNQAGVISQGTISVVSGNFTAAISFKSYATGGRLDIFNVDANGKENNEVQISVTF